MAKKKDAALSFMEKVYAKLPADQRTAIQSVLNGNDEALEEIGTGVLAQEAYTRQVQETQQERLKAEAHKANLDKWFQDNHQALLSVPQRDARIAELEAYINAQGSGDDTKVDTSKFIDKDTFNAAEARFTSIINQTSNNAAILASVMPVIAVKHFQDFGEVLNTNEFFDHVRKVGIPIDKGGYDSYVADRRSALKEKEFTKKLEEAEKRGFEKAQMQNSQFPGATFRENPNGDVGAFEFLKAEKKGDYSTEAAVAEFNRMRST